MGVTYYIMRENLIWQEFNLAIFTIRQTAKLKSSPNFPAIRYILHSLCMASPYFFLLCIKVRTPGATPTSSVSTVELLPTAMKQRKEMIYQQDGNFQTEKSTVADSELVWLFQCNQCCACMNFSYIGYKSNQDYDPFYISCNISPLIHRLLKVLVSPLVQQLKFWKTRQLNAVQCR